MDVSGKNIFYGEGYRIVKYISESGENRKYYFSIKFTIE